MAKSIYNNYGVKMTPLQDMQFQLYVNSLKFGMNTISKEERFKIAKDWLSKQNC